MGDVVMTLPALGLLKQHFPDCRITYFTDAAFAPIALLSGHVDTVESIDRRAFAKPPRLPGAAVQALRLALRLRAAGFHMAFDLQGFGETALFAYLSGAPLRVGRIKNSALRKHVYNLPVGADWAKDHRCLFFLKAVAEAWALPLPVPTPPPALPAAHSGRRENLVGLNIGASTESRRWSERHFFELARRLSAKGYPIRIFTGPEEGRLLGAVRASCDRCGWEHFHHQTIEGLVSSLGPCGLVVSNDTGPGHLAAALGCSVVTLFSTGSPDNVRPLAPRARFLRSSTDINRISPTQVEEACLELLPTPLPIT